MILDRIENWGAYFTKETKLYAGIKFIMEHADKNTPDGRYDIEGDDLYAMVQSYTTDTPVKKKLESHKKYLDIQCLISGREIIRWIPAYKLEVMTPYLGENDVIFYHNNGYISPLLLTPGVFSVFYPLDAHMPGCFLDKPEFVRKIVVKVKI